MTSPQKDLVAALGAIGRGDAPPAQATAIIRKALSADADLTERVYAALHDVVWRMLMSRSVGDEGGAWFDVVRHTAALAKRRSATSLYDRMRVLSDFISRTSRFADLQPVEEVLKRKHTREAIKTLAAGKGPVMRARLAERLELADANLSRVLSILVSSGLVERSASGKEAFFRLTDQGKAAAKAFALTSSDTPPDPETWWDEVPIGIAIWDEAGRPLNANQAFRELASGSEPSAELSPLDEWRIKAGTSALDERISPIDRSRELRVSADRWVRYTEHRTSNGRRLVTGLDISASKQLERELEVRIGRLTAEEKTLTKNLAEAERRLLAYRAAVGQMRDELVNMAGSAVTQLGQSIGELAKARPAKTLAPHLREVEIQMHALKTATQHFIDVPEPQSAATQLVDARRLIEDVVGAAKVFGDPDITVDFGHHFGAVLAPSALGTALGQLLVVLPWRQPGAEVKLMATVEKGFVVMSLSSGVSAGIPDLLFEEYGLYRSDVSTWRLGHCQTVVADYGGRLEMRIDAVGHDFVHMAFPIEKRRAAIRTRAPARS